MQTTNDLPKYNYTFDGDGSYTLSPCVGVVKALRHSKQFVHEVKEGQDCGVLLDQTCFYAEQGGQTYDQGFMVKDGDDEVEFAVKNVQVRRIHHYTRVCLYIYSNLCIELCICISYV